MITEKIHQASFKGAFFYWRRLSTELGKKSVSHNYPGTARRFVEDMGALPKTFTIEALVSGSPSTDEYWANKQALENALSSDGPGYLIHPTYGRVLVTAKPATCTENQQSIGEAVYSLTFEKADEVSRPVGTASTQTQIATLATQATSEIAEVAEDSWTVPDSPSVYSMVTSKIQGLSSQMSSVINSVSSVKSDAYAVYDSIANMEETAAQLVAEPAGLFGIISTIYSQITEMDDTVEDQLTRLTSFFGESSDSGPGQSDSSGDKISAISYETEEAETNRVVMNETSNLSALVNAYNAISQIDFDSTDQLDEFVEAVENQFTVISGCSLMQTALRDTIINLRTAAHQVIEEKRLSTSAIITSEFKSEIPLSVALYMYAGDLDDIDYIVGLNSDQDITFAKGEVSLLE